MGVSRYDYVVIGYKLPYKFKDVVTGDGVDWYDDTFLPYVEGRKGVDFSIILDWMVGDYVVFGKILAKGNDDEGFGFKNINYEDSDFDKVKEKFLELFGGYDIMDYFDKNPNPRLFVFSNFS